MLGRTAFREGGLANWPGSPRRQIAGADGHIRLQWCTGAPGVLAGAYRYLDEELLLAGAELIWRAGAHGDDKGHGSQVERLCVANGRGRYSLFTGDVGTALFAAACLEGDARYPIFDIV